MKRVLKYLGIILGGLLILLLLSAAGLYVATRGEYSVPATVTDDPTLPRVEIDGYTFHAETYGDPQNPVVIVLHGGPGGDYRSLLGLQALADEYFVVFYDQRGAGLSERVPADQLTLASSLSDLDAFVERFSPGRPVHLVGHSWGAMLASAYLGYAPEKVARAVLAEPGFLNAAEFRDWQAYYNRLVSKPGFIWIMLEAGFKAQHVRGLDTYASEDFLVGANIVPYFANLPDNPYHCPGEPFDAPAWRWGATAGNAIQGSASELDLDSLSAHAGDTPHPLLFLAGECDTWIGPELQARHVAMFPNAELVVIPGAGHDMFWDNPQATLPAVRAFVAK